MKDRWFACIQLKWENLFLRSGKALTTYGIFESFRRIIALAHISHKCYITCHGEEKNQDKFYKKLVSQAETVFERHLKNIQKKEVVRS